MSLPPFQFLPGGQVLASANAVNTFADNAAKRKFNQVKAQYAPQLTMADINSKNAYAQLVGLQPMAKVLASMPGFASLSEDQKNALVQKLYNSGGGTLSNSLMQL